MMIKNILRLLFLMCAMHFYAQQEHPPLYLEYDKAGNQIVSDLLCVNCPEAAGEKHLLDAITYYPNPVQQQLTLSWKNTETVHVTSVRVYDLNGRQLTSKDNLSVESELNLSFSNNTAGIYIIEVLSSDGTIETFKIIKK
ncbi:MAG: T9SS type A sorting domain-containing protein [Bacteroidota bacterium]